jgi:hypothetical protein
MCMSVPTRTLAVLAALIATLVSATATEPRPALHWTGGVHKQRHHPSGGRRRHDLGRRNGGLGCCR